MGVVSQASGLWWSTGMMKNKLTINTAQAQKIKESAVCESAVNLCLDMPSKVNKVDQPSRYIETELGKEKLCIECNEYWPLDDEFWSHRIVVLVGGNTSKRYESVCKSCYDIRYRPNRTKTKNRIKSAYEKRAVI